MGSATQHSQEHSPEHSTEASAHEPAEHASVPGSNSGQAARAERARSERRAGGGAHHASGEHHAATNDAATSGREAQGGETAGGVAAPESRAVIDLSDVITVGRLASALRAIADEPGESGTLKFEVKASGKFGTGAVNAMVEGWAELSIGYAVDNSNLSQLFIDAEGAIAAGVDLAGFAQVMVEGGFGKDFLNRWVSGAEAAATWIMAQLRRLNDAAGGKVFNFGSGEAADRQRHAETRAQSGHGGHGGGGHGEGGGAPSFEVHDTKVFGGVKGHAGMGPISADASYRHMEMDRVFHDQHHHEIPSHEVHDQSEVGFQVMLGKHGGIGVTYNRDYNVTTGSPIYYTNGVFCEHSIALSLLLKDLIEKGGKEVEQIPPAAVQDLVLKVFGGLEKVAGHFPYAGALNYELFSSMVEEMYKGAEVGGKLSLDVLFNIIFEWHEYGEANGDLNLMFFRVKVEPVAKLEVGGKTLAGGVEAGVSASKSEVIFEHIGSETVSYIQRQFIYQSPERPWEDFKAANREQIEQLARNMATPGFAYYVPAVAAALQSGSEGENFDAAIRAMEEHWLASDSRLQQIAPDAARIGEELGSATSIFTWFDSTKREHLHAIFAVFAKYEDDPQQLAFFLEQLPAYDVDLGELEGLARDLGEKQRYDAIRRKATGAAGGG